MQVDIDLPKVLFIFLFKLLEKVQSDLLGLDAVHTNGTAELDSQSDLGLKEGKLVIGWDGER